MPPPGLACWWQAEGSGDDAVFAPGRIGQAFSFSGAPTEYVTVPDSPALNVGTTDFSLAVWIKTSDTGSRKRIVTKRPSSSVAWYSLSLDNDKVNLELTGTDTVTSSVSVADGQWHHLALTRDPVFASPRYYHLYIDGAEDTRLTDTGLNLATATAPLEFGKWATENSTSNIYSGLIDEVQLFNRALTPAEIQIIYSSGLVLPPTVTGVLPSSGSAFGGTPVTITGTELTGATIVTFNSTPATGVTVDSATQVRAVSPAGVAGHVVDITVTTPGGTSAVSSADQFTYTQDQAKIVTTDTTYASLTAALQAAQAGAEIRAYDAQVDGAFTLGTGLVLRGGFDATFMAKTGNPTTLNGDLTATSGNSSVESLVVHGKLTLQGGALKAFGVTVR